MVLTGKRLLNVPGWVGPIPRILVGKYERHEEYVQLYYDTDVILKAKGFTWPYLLSDFLAIMQGLPEDDDIRKFFWNHFFTVCQKKHLYPTVIKPVSDQTRRSFLQQDYQLEMEHVWDERFSYPDCLHDDALPLLAITHLNGWNFPVIRPADESDYSQSRIRAPDMLWNLLYTFTRRVISAEPLHFNNRQARKHAQAIPGINGGSERDTFGLHLPHGTADGSCKKGLCDVRTTSLLIQELCLAGEDYCAGAGSIRASQVLRESGWVPSVARQGNGWTPYHGFAMLARAGLDRNAGSIELLTYEALEKMMDRQESNYKLLPRLNLPAMSFTTLQGADLYT
ncbi:hypothetical protein IAT40_000713 [Kwoniella sp. CBS 6097]